MIRKASKLGTELTKNELRKILGGRQYCEPGPDFRCPPNQCCSGIWCVSSPGAPAGSIC